MNDIWLCTFGDKKLLIRCERSELSWHDARSFAAKKLGVEPYCVEALRSEIDAVPAVLEWEVVEVRWTGDDYAHGGTPGRRRMQEREPGGEWVDV